MKKLRLLMMTLCVTVLMGSMAVTAYAGGGEEWDGLDPVEPLPTETVDPGEGFTEDGNLVTRDLLYDKATNKQFITVQTSGGNTFYIIIDYDKPTDEDGEQYQTYFLNMVDEADLTALLEELDIDVPDTTPESTPTPKPTVEVVPEPDEPNGVNSSILLIVFALLVGGVILYYFKVIKKKPKQKVPSYTDEYDMDDDDIWEKEV